jgi:hypothetical protein
MVSKGKKKTAILAKTWLPKVLFMGFVIAAVQITATKAEAKVTDGTAPITAMMPAGLQTFDKYKVLSEPMTKEECCNLTDSVYYVPSDVTVDYQLIFNNSTVCLIIKDGATLKVNGMSFVDNVNHFYIAGSGQGTGSIAASGSGDLIFFNFAELAFSNVKALFSGGGCLGSDTLGLSLWNGAQMVVTTDSLNSFGSAFEASEVTEADDSYFIVDGGITLTYGAKLVCDESSKAVILGSIRTIMHPVILRGNIISTENPTAGSDENPTKETLALYQTFLNSFGSLRVLDNKDKISVCVDDAYPPYVYRASKFDYSKIKDLVESLEYNHQSERYDDDGYEYPQTLSKKLQAFDGKIYAWLPADLQYSDQYYDGYDEEDLYSDLGEGKTSTEFVPPIPALNFSQSLDSRPSPTLAKIKITSPVDGTVYALISPSTTGDHGAATVKSNGNSLGSITAETPTTFDVTLPDRNACTIYFVIDTADTALTDSVGIDVPAYIQPAAAVTGLSASKADGKGSDVTISFTSDQAGTAYYSIFSNGKIAITNALIANCGKILGDVKPGLNTFTVTSKLKNAKIYVVVKNVDGTLSPLASCAMPKLLPAKTKKKLARSAATIVKSASGEKPQVSMKLKVSPNKLNKISLKGKTLEKGVDYEIDGKNINFSDSFINSLSKGTYYLRLDFNLGATNIFTINVK